MAIYGINFNNTPIPPGVARRFPKQIKLPGMGRGEYARLAGVAQSEEERDAMLVQASNGHRRLHVEPRRTAAARWFGIYVHHCDAVPEDDPGARAALGRTLSQIRAEIAPERRCLHFEDDYSGGQMVTRRCTRTHGHDGAHAMAQWGLK